MTNDDGGRTTAAAGPPIELDALRAEHDRVVRSLEAAERGVMYLAYHDDLTGLPNRSLLREHLDLALARARRTGTAVALLAVDLDDFKLVNDSLGPAVGDELLCRVASRLRNAIRDTDLLARQGGDDFLVLLTDLDRATAAKHAGTVAGHVLRALRHPVTLEGIEIQVGASVGIGLHPHDSEDAETLFKHADAALYEVKSGGRGGWGTYTGAGPDPLERLSLIRRLARALERDEFLLHYQPIVELKEGGDRIVGVEALLRWQDPERGMIPPGDFIPLAEQTGQIEVIGDWVIDALLAQGRVWADEGLHPELSLNVSPRQLRRPELAEVVRAALAKHGIDPRFVTVEITESATVRDPERTEPLLAELERLGVRLAIDDFGAGYSSLGRLRQMPVHTLKIDRSFLREIPESREAGEVVGAMIGLARALGMGIVAEGVETEEQREYLLARGCPHAQGFHLGRPIPAAEMTQLLRKEAYRHAVR